MKFGDNILFKACETKAENNYFRPLIEDEERRYCLTTTYSFDVGINAMMEHLYLRMHCYDMKVEVACDNYVSKMFDSIEEALRYLKDKDLTEVEKIETIYDIGDLIEHTCFELYPEDEEVLKHYFERTRVE